MTLKFSNASDHFFITPSHYKLKPHPHPHHTQCHTGFKTQSWVITNRGRKGKMNSLKFMKVTSKSGHHGSFQAKRPQPRGSPYLWLRSLVAIFLNHHRGVVVLLPSLELWTSYECTTDVPDVARHYNVQIIL
ncbi:uncharacterized protein LOC133803727 [Humulus lupulus]|uniref:uncharacterized protein LOC133803727 n=1 Tax=Humulus lupulus TaxID=3486 RepID=UPI002B402DDD|nr:uncharacterized protein LOC133803727 [Humulus lupulus]